MRQVEGCGRRSAASANLILRALRWSRLFRDWPEESLAALAAGSRLQEHDRRTHLLRWQRRPNDVLVVASGCIELARIHESGKKFTHSWLGPGEVVGLPVLLKENIPPAAYQYFAHEQTVLICIPAQVLLAILEARPELWQGIAKMLLRRQLDHMRSVEEQALHSLRERTRELLCHLVHTYGVPGDGQPGIQLRLRQDDLAAMLGVSRQSVNKELKRLARDDLISQGRGLIAVKDLNALQQTAESRRGSDRRRAE